MGNVPHDMVLNRPLYYFTVPGVGVGGIDTFMGLKFSEDVLPWKEFDVRADTDDVNANAVRVFYSFLQGSYYIRCRG